MHKDLNERSATVLFIPHGGGPLPLLGDEQHQEMVDFLKKMGSTLKRPSAILVISAHWEEDAVTITSAPRPELIYDYSGFGEAAYQIRYPAPGDPGLAKKLYDLLQANSVEARLDSNRGFDHGLFVPLKIMFPEADIPCVQMSLLHSLDPQKHIQIGKALSALKDEDLLILGSGFSFHNLRAFFSPTGAADEKNEAFEHWLIDTCTNETLSEEEREQRLISWAEAPFARYCQPREEHLLPLHICYAISGAPAALVFEGRVMGKRTSAYLWQSELL